MSLVTRRASIWIYNPASIARRHVGNRLSHYDARARLSSLWVPSGGIAPVAGGVEDSHALLIRAGFLRQAHSGFFHLLPLGLRVQEKIEHMIERHMNGLGASKVSLSSISSEELWHESGRLDDRDNKELFRIQDRKKGRYLLSPTHEEEMTSLVASVCQSYKELPLRLYQISRKYRDEPRPRQGLLRSREFLMKDLYTFDHSPNHARATYDEVRKTYNSFFDELKIPYLVADADSGNMGGSLSHEYLLATPKGEDQIVRCSSCGYTANEELAEGLVSQPDSASRARPGSANPRVALWSGITHDRLGLVNVFYPLSESGEAEINTHAVKRLVPSLDAGMEDPVGVWKKSFVGRPDSEAPPTGQSNVINLYDHRLPSQIASSEFAERKDFSFAAVTSSYLSQSLPTSSFTSNPTTGSPLDLLKIRTGDACPRCSDGRVDVTKAIELGHTFLLGTRYSEPFGATVTVKTKDRGEASGQTALQMGCHGIGISRMIGAVADALADERGLNWPRVMAPYDVVIISDEQTRTQAEEVYDLLETGRWSAPTAALDNKSDAAMSLLRPGVDAILDDRDKPLAWKLKDGDFVGYPVLVVLGRGWKTKELAEVQCRRLGVREEVSLMALKAFVGDLLGRL